MSEDAAHELQVAIVTCLKADADVTALIAGRVYDRVPQGVSLPYVSFGPTQELPEDADGLDLSDLFIQLSVWSDDPGFAEGGGLPRRSLRRCPVIRFPSMTMRLSISNWIADAICATRTD